MLDITDQLRVWATSLEESAAPADIDAIASTERTTSERRANRRWTAVAASVVVLVGGIVAVGYFGNDDSDDLASAPSDTTAIGTTAPTTSATAPTASADVGEPVESPADTIVLPLPRAADDLAVSSPLVADFAGLPLTDISISPSGEWIASNRENEICLLNTLAGSESPDEGCVEVPGSVAPGSLVWSPDESKIAFNTDLFRLQQDPDIVVLDVSSRTVEVLTDDDTDDAEIGLLDITPFYDDAGNLFFFRLGDDAFAPTIMQIGDVEAPLDDIAFDGIPTGARRDPFDGNVAVSRQGRDEVTSIATIDLSGGTVDVSAPAPGPVVDVSGGRALIETAGDETGEAARTAIVDLVGATPARAVPSAPAASDRAVVGTGLSPDGSQIVMIIEHRTDPAGHELVLAPILSDGSLGQLGVIATGEEFAPNDDDVTIRPHGLGFRDEVVWTQDRILFGLGPNQLVTLELAD